MSRIAEESHQGSADELVRFCRHGQRVHALGVALVETEVAIVMVTHIPNRVCVYRLRGRILHIPEAKL
jgi:hypothetical protein